MKMVRWLHDLGCHNLPPLDRKLSLKQAYINEFEWVDPSKTIARELAIFAMSDKSRGLYQIMPKMSRVREYRIYEVGKHYNMSLPEWLQLPREYIAMIIEDLQNELLLEKAMAEKKERELREQERKAGLGHSQAASPSRWPGT